MMSIHRHWLGSTALTVAPALVAFSLGSEAQALPKNGQVSAGEAQITTPQAKRLKIEQASDRAIIDWQSFDIAADEKVEIVQPGDHASLLNRVIGGGDASRILGELVANGRVVLVNPGGIDIDVTARIDVGGLIASTANISNRNFLDGRLNFDEPGAADARILNRGAITAAEGGLVALVAPGVANTGVITARLGKIALASGTRFTLDLYGDDLVRIAVDGAVMQRVLGVDGEVLEALVSNEGSLSADGGLIQVSAAAADGVVDTLINMGGHVRAQTVAQVDGEIVLGGRGGAVIASAEIDASGAEAGERGGTVKILGERVGLTNGARIDASGDAGGGEVLIGGNFQGLGPEQNAEMTTIQSDVRIDVSARRSGNGGTAIVWADSTTRFHGRISADGGSEAGNGGLVEVSGKQTLIFRGDVSTAAPNGMMGNLLLDPDDIVIADGSGGANDAEVTGDGQILFADGGQVTFTISEQALEGIAAGTTLTLQASNSITLNDLSDNELSLNQTGTVSFQAGAGGFSMNTGDTIAMSGAGGNLSINMSAGVGTGSITLGNVTFNGGVATFNAASSVSTQGISGAAGVTLQATNGVTVNGAISSSEAINIDADSDDSGTGDFTLASGGSLATSNDQISITADDVILASGTTINAGTALVIMDPGDTGSFVAVGSNAAASFAVDNNELQRITAGSLRIGDDETGSFNVTGVNTSDFTNISGTIELRSGDSLSFDEIGGGTHAFTTLSVFAKNGVSLNSGEVEAANLSTTGTLSVDADSDDNGSGNFSIPSNSSVTASNAAISIIANDVSINSTGSLSAGTSSVTLAPSDGGTVAVGGGTAGNFTISDTELQRITAGSLQIGDDASAKLTVTGVTTGDLTNISGLLTLRTGADLLIDDNGGTAHSFKTLSLIAKNGVTLESDSGNSSNFTTTGALTIDADSEDSGAGTLALNDGTSINSNNNPISIVANDMNLTSGAVLNAGTSSVTISVSDGGTIGLGTAQGLTLDATELPRITAASLLIGTSGDAAGNISAANVDTAGEFANISGAITLRSQNGSISFSGTNSTPGALTLEAKSGVNINGGVSASGNILIDADIDDDGSGDLSIANSITLTSTGNVTAILADYAGNTSGSLSASSGTVEIRASQTAKTFALGTAEIGNIGFTNTELTNITANSLVIGATSGDTNGSIFAEGLTAASTANLNSLTLNAYTSEADVILSSANIVANTLNVNAVDRIAISGDQTTNAGALTLIADANSGGDSNNDITLGDGVDLTGAGGLVLTASGGITGAGTTTLNAGDGGVTLNNTITNTSNAITVDADTNNNGNGTLTIVDGAQLNGSGQTVTVIAADIALGGTTGTRIHGSTLTIRSSDNSGINLGGSGSSINLSDTEIARLLAFTTNFGDATDAVTVTVDTVSDADAENLGSVNIDTTKSVTFTGASQFDSLNVDADNGVIVNGNLTTDSGNLNLNGDQDNSADGTDSITFAAGVTLTAVGGEIQLTAKTGGLSTAGALTLTSESDVHINDALTLSGALNVTTDSNQTESGAFLMTADAAINSQNNNISIRTKRTELNAAVNAGTGTLTILSSTTSRTFAFGADVGGSFSFDAAQLENITASELIIGAVSGNTMSTIDVRGVTGPSTDNIGTVTLNAFSSGADVTFTTSASNFDGNLNANAVDKITVDQTLSVGGSVTLTANVTGSMDTINAANGITLNASMGGTGSITLDADSDNNGSGTLTISDGDKLKGIGLTVSITAADIALNGTSGVRLEAGTLNIRSSDNAGINIGGSGSGMDLSDSELARISATTTNFGNAADPVAITVDSVSDADGEALGSVNLDTTTAVTFNGVSQFDVLNVDADNGVAVNGNLTTDSGNLDLNGDQDNAADGTDSITFAAGVSLTAIGGRIDLTAPTNGFSAAGSLTLTGTTGVVLDDPLTLSGSLNINADSDADGTGSFTNASDAVVNTQNNNATIQTAGPFFGATLNVGTGTLTLLASTTGTAIGLGEELELPFSLNNTVLSKVTANEFIVGAVSGATNGNILLSGITGPTTANIGTVTLNAFTAGADITFTGSASTFNGNLNLNATDKIDVNQNLTVGGALTLTATNQGSLQDLTVANGITFNADMNAGGTLALNSDSNGDGSGNFTIADGKQLSASTSSITITAADVALGGSSGSRISSAGSVTFFSSDNSGINLGTAGSSINLSNTELARIAANNLSFGNDTASASITVSGVSVSDLAGITGNVSFGSAVSTTFSGAASSFKSMSTGEGGPVNVNVDLSTTTGDLNLSGNGINFGAGVSASSAGNMTLDAGSSSVSATGALTLQAAGNLTVNQNLTAGGAVVLKADSDASGAGQFQLGSGATVNSNNNAISIFTTEFDLDGSLNAGTGLATLGVSLAGTTMGLGDSRVAGTFVATNSELARITAGNLIIGTTSSGSAASGSISIDALTSAGLANIAGATNINALNAGADINVVSASTLGAGTFNAEDNIAINADLTGSGALILSADADGDGTGGVTVQSGATVTSGNNDITVSASSLDLSGTLNAGTGTFVVTNPTGILVVGTGGFTGGNFANVTAAGINLGGGLASTVRIAGVAESDFASFDSAVAISAAAVGGVVSFETTASTFERLSVSGSRIDVGTDVSTTQADLSFGGPVQLTGPATLSSGNSTLQFSGSIDGAFALTLDAGGGSLLAGGAIGATTALASLTATGASSGFSGVTTSGAQIFNGATSIAGNHTSAGGALNFNGAVTTTSPVSAASGGGAIAFNGTLDGANPLTLNAGAGDIAFNQNVGATTRLGALTIESAGNVSVGGTLKSGAFTITSATGTVDLGFSSLDADGDVSITASQIEGKITGKVLTLKTTGAGAGVSQALQIFVDSLDLDAVAAALEGLIGGSASPEANLLTANLSGGGSLTFNGQDLATLINGIDATTTTTQNLAVEVASNQVENLVTESQDEVLSDDDGGPEELEEVLESVATDGGGQGGDGLVEVIGSEEIADIDDEEDEDQEGGCGCG